MANIKSSDSLQLVLWICSKWIKIGKKQAHPKKGKKKLVCFKCVVLESVLTDCEVKTLPEF